jgi:uncharacterized protein YbaP (TraB family)
MLRNILLCLALWSAGMAQAACGTTPLTDRFTPAQTAQLAAAAAATPFGQGIAWQATRGPRTITLLGTFHLPDPRHAALLDRFLPAISGADVLLVEATPEDEAALQQAVQADPAMIFITDGPTLPEQLDEATWDALSAAMRDRGIPPAVGSRFRPWFLMVSLSMPPCAMGQMTAGAGGLDKLLIRAAQDSGVPVAALEPWQTVFTLLAQESDATQIDLLRTALMDTSLQEAMFVAMADGYFAGQIAEIWEMGRVAMAFVPGLTPAQGAAFYARAQDLLIDRRNRAWIEVIESAADSHDSVVVAAGAAHLPGTAGLLALLQDRGWTITPLP